MLAILRKELRSYFSSPLAYIVIAIFLFLLGYLFVSLLMRFSMLSINALRSPMVADKISSTDLILRQLFINFGFLFLIIIPVLTMRSFAEEKRLGSIELLFSYPLTDMQIVLGKFFGVFIVGACMVALTFVYPTILVSYIPKIEWGVILTGYIGVLLLLAAFLSLGLWASSLSDNLVVAYMSAFGGLLIFWIIGWLKSLFTGPVIDYISSLSVLEHLESFSKGVIDTADIVYFLLFCAFFLFCTFLSLESRKWKA